MHATPHRPEHGIRQAGSADADVIARLLHDFNREFDEPTPEPPVLAARIRQLLNDGDTTVLLADDRGGLAVHRFRAAIWSNGNECTLAELYVTRHHRGRGLGRALLEAAIDAAHRRRADYLEVATGANNLAARALYEQLGFTHQHHGEITYHYQRELPEPTSSTA